MDLAVGWDKVVAATACALAFKVLAPIAEAFGEAGGGGCIAGQGAPSGRGRAVPSNEPEPRG